jgi:hypothetical protein
MTSISSLLRLGSSDELPGVGSPHQAAVDAAASVMGARPSRQ